jgi:uncharacterized protein (TIGR03118 family)
MHRLLTAFVGLLFTCVVGTRAIRAQAISYQQTNLVADTRGLAANVDPRLTNPQGIAHLAGQPLWVANNGSGFSTLYSASGVPTGHFPIPASSGSSGGSAPSAIVANPLTAGFHAHGQASQFMIATERGVIAAANGSDPVTVVVDNSKAGAVYKGLAVVTNGSGSFLLAANFSSGAVDVFDASFQSAALAGNFTDPEMPAGFAPLGIQVINNQVLVTFAMQDAAKHEAVHQVGAGLVDLFDLNGNFLLRLVSQGMLNAPRAAVLAPAGFGALAGKLLVGNSGDGTITAFDLFSGNFIDQVKDAHGAPITNPGLGAMVFVDGGASGGSHGLLIAAGLANGQHGLLAEITATPDAAAADFTISVSPTTATLSSGQSASFTVAVGAMNGFNSVISFTCSGQPAYSTCVFAPTTLTPPSGGTASTSFTLATGTGTYIPPMSMYGLIEPPGAWLGFLEAGLFLLAMCAFRSVGFARGGDYSLRGRQASGFGFLWSASLLFLAISALSLGGCGGYGGSRATPKGANTVIVTGTSGTISHSANISLTIQ